MKPLRDVFTFTPTFLQTEGSEGQQRLRVRGESQRINWRGENGRVYSDRLWKKILDAQGPLQERLKANKVLGQLEHPDSGITKLSSVSHIVNGLTIDGDRIIGDFTILKTEGGRILEELFSAGVPVAVSSRGRGTTVRTKNEGGISNVEVGEEYEDVNPDDFEFDTFDFVYQPSFETARPQPVYESAGNDGSRRKEVDSMKDPKRVWEAIGNAERLIAGVKTSYNSGKFESLHEAHGQMSHTLLELSDMESEEYDKRLRELRGELMTWLDVVGTQLRKKEDIETKGDGKDAMDESQVSLISKMTKRMVEMKKEKKEVETQLETLRKRYDAAVSLCEGLVTRCKKYKNGVSESNGFKKRYDAAIQLLEAVVKRVRENSVQSYIREKLGEDKRLEAASDLLSEATTIEQVNKIIDGAKKLLEKSPYPSDLPPVHKNALVEDKKTTSTSNGLISSLAKKGY